MIKFAIGPQHGVVALLTSSREARLRMVHRRGSRVEILLVATDASRVGSAQVVIIVHVALRALRAAQVEAGQRPTRCRVIEFRVSPVGRVVALLASGRETELRMIHRRGGSVVVLLMATHAGRAAERVIVVNVAHHARDGRIGVKAGQSEAYGAVIKVRRSPS